jgi:patatin-like phospholipase
MAAYRILSLDGGGSWALLQVMALQALCGPKEQGHDVLKRFDLVAANGGGSVTLAGLAMNMQLQEVLEKFFLDERSRNVIFGCAEGGWPWEAASTIRLEALRDLLGNDGKEPMSKLFGKIKLHGGVGPDLLIGAFDWDRKRAEFFRSDLNSQSASSTNTDDPTLAEVIQSSVTNPISDFEALAKIRGARFCDGGAAGLYNPVLAAVTEALANRRVASSIQVLSIGTCTVQKPLSLAPQKRWWQRKTRAKTTDISGNLARGAFDDPSDAATYIAHVVLGQPLPSSQNPPPTSGSVVRLSPVLRLEWDHKKNGWVSQSGVSDKMLAQLAKLTKGSIEQKDIDVIKGYGDLWIRGAVYNQPIRANGDFKCEIGHERFPVAIGGWRALTGERAPAEGASPVAA